MTAKKNRPVSDYQEYTTYRGEEIKVYAVPQQLIRGITPTKDKPKRPWVEMKTKTGTQKRPAKKGDAQWDVFQDEMESWEEEQDELQEAVSMVMAVRDYSIPTNPQLADFPDHVKVLIESGLLKLSDNIWIKKFSWLRAGVLGQHDEYQISLIIQKLSGVPEDIIDEMKANFRRVLLGQNRSGMEAGNGVGSQDAESNFALEGGFLETE